MENYDDLFASAKEQKSEENPQFVSFDKESWAEQKKQDRKTAYEMIDQATERMKGDVELLIKYLEVQAKFDRYSVGNALLVAMQRPDMTEPADAKAWKERGVYIKKGENSILILEPGEEFTRKDGSVGVSFRTKRVFDISQTTAISHQPRTVSSDPRMLISALIHNAPCKIEISEAMPENTASIYRGDQKTIRVRKGLEAPQLFASLSQELAYAHLDKGDFKRSENEFVAFCAAFIVCKRNNLGMEHFSLDRIPAKLQSMSPQDVRKELGKIRDTANTISANMNHYLDKAKAARAKENEAR